MWIIAIIIVVIVLLFLIAKYSSNAKSSIRETEKILRTQVAEQDKRLNPNWLAIKSQLEADGHTSSDIEMFFIGWKKGEWASFEDTAEMNDYFPGESTETRRRIRNVFFKASDKHDAWESFFFKNGRSMTRDDIKLKHQEYLGLDDDEYKLYQKYDLGVSVEEYLLHDFNR